MDSNKGREIYNLAEAIFPFCRSITGAGVRETLSVLAEYVGDKNRTGGGR